MMPRFWVSVKWVWQLANPGMTARPRPDTRSAFGNRASTSAAGPIAAMLLPSTAMAAPWWTGAFSSPVTTVVSWITVVMRRFTPMLTHSAGSGQALPPFREKGPWL